MEHICKICHSDPGSHSFSLLCTYNNNLEQVHLFYTRIADSKRYNDKEGIIKHYENYLNFINPISWTWIIDFDDFQLKHSLELSTTIGLSKLIKKFGKVNKIIIINQSKYLKYLLEVVKPLIGNLNEKITIFGKNNKDKLHILLNEINLDKEYIDFLMKC
jgi:hypothetical protein